MSFNRQQYRGDDTDHKDEETCKTGAWHISSAGARRDIRRSYDKGNAKSSSTSRETKNQVDIWPDFESDETLHDNPGHSQRRLTTEGKLQQDTSAPTPVGFWSLSLLKTRREVFVSYLKTLSILCVFVLTVLSIYWGVLAKVYDNLDHVTVAVVSFDGLEPYQEIQPLVGPVVIAEALAQLPLFRSLGYVVRSPSDFDNDPMNVRIAVHDEKFWAAIVVNSNATALLRQAVEGGNSSYDPLGAAQIIYNQARDVESYNQYVSPPLTALASSISLKFGANWTSNVLSNQTLDSAVYSNAPQALSPGIAFSIFNLRPFDPPTVIPAVSIGLIYLIIIAFFSFGFFIPTHMKFISPNPTSPHPPLRFHQLVLWRYTATIFAYFCMSLSYSLVSLAFQIPFSHSPSSTSGVSPRHWPKTDVVDNADYLDHATFVVYWLLNFTGMSALGLACENMAMLLGTPWTALWLIFWVITNVATGFYSLELASGFYRWGYLWPLRQIVLGSRTLLFGTKDMLGLNCGILFAWIVVGTALFPVCCWVFRWKSIREKKRLAGVQSGAGG